MAKDKGLTALEKVMIAAKAADSKKATDIVIQDVRELVSVTDFFVIVTAQNNRQVAGALPTSLSRAAISPISRGCAPRWARCAWKNCSIAPTRPTSCICFLPTW